MSMLGKPHEEPQDWVNETQDIRFLAVPQAGSARPRRRRSDFFSSLSPGLRESDLVNSPLLLAPALPSLVLKS